MGDWRLSGVSLCGPGKKPNHADMYEHRKGLEGSVMRVGEMPLRTEMAGLGMAAPLDCTAPVSTELCKQVNLLTKTGKGV